MVLGVAVVAGALLGAGSTGAQAAVEAHAVSLTLTWTQTLNDAGGPIALSSPNVATLAGGPSVVVGDRAGNVYAFNLASGAGVSGWPVSTGGVPVDSTPSVAVTGGGGLDSVFVGEGNAATPTSGGYLGITPQGGTMWFTNVQNPSTDTAPAKAVQASMAVGNLNGGTDVVAGSLGEVGQAMNASNGAMLPGFPWFQADSNFTTPALGDVEGNGRTYIVEGGDSSAGSAYGTTYTNGGHLRVLSPTGNSGSTNPGAGLVCQYNTDQTVQSSPAVGEMGGSVGIVFGTGATYSGAGTTNDLIEVNSQCVPRWSVKLDGTTTSSPALADILGNGQLDVLEGTRVGSTGSIWALNGVSGATIWHTATAGQVIGSPVSADLTGGGYQDAIVPTTAGVQIFDGKSGALVATLGQSAGLAFQNSPLVTDDPNGSLGLTLAGYNSSNQGVIQHYEVTGSSGATADETGAWPMFHHDSQLTGNAGLPSPVVEVPCNAPSGSPVGYDMTASDGGVFNYGNLPFCGSTGNLFLTKPVVGVAVTHDGGGYWLVASDGGVFAFGDAAFHGSAGNIALTKPVVGMAVTHDGGGYWLVASDGGVFSYGDATFYGSAGNIHLTKPVVGMAVTPDGKGYWLVASDGGVFSYGDAVFHGSTGNIHLTKPVVGMAADSQTGGYWLVASDGGVFAYDSPFYGSAGNLALVKPVVGMMATQSGGGYRLTASDGGIFDYGTAPFYGSTGAIHLTQPMVGVAGF
ncbi:MAG: hypothetical protein ABSC30_06685 [Acidimicrobiales bacterium]